MTRAGTRAGAAGFLDRYFGGFSCARAKLALFRVLFFGMVGLDAIWQLPHAPRYGAGDFNVGHFAWLDALLPAPGRSLMVVVFLGQAYLALAMAFGRATRAGLVALTVLYGYGYFVSQLDSYQHHYLVFLLLLLGCFVPWHGSPEDGDGGRDARTRDGGDAMTRSWAVRLIIVQVAVVYAWTAITKLEQPWLDGSALGAQLGSGMTRDMGEWLGMGTMATMVALAEIFLCVALLWSRLWPLAVVVGWSLHAGIEFGAEFKIGIFSYYMFAFYLLLLPDRWYVALDRRLAPARARLGAAWERVVGTRPLAWGLGLLALLGGGACLWSLPVQQAGVVALGACGFAAALALGRWRVARRGDGGAGRSGAGVIVAAHLMAAAVMLGSPWTWEAMGDYYKYWGGSARRLGQWDEAEVAYRELVRLRPGWGSAHYHLGRIEERDGDVDAALAHYRRAQEANPEDYRPFLNEAAIHHRARRGPEAVAAARRALEALRAAKPSRSAARATEQAQAIVTSWPGAGGAR